MNIVNRINGAPCLFVGSDRPEIVCASLRLHALECSWLMLTERVLADARLCEVEKQFLFVAVAC